MVAQQLNQKNLPIIGKPDLSVIGSELKRQPKIGFLHVTTWEKSDSLITTYYGRLHGGQTPNPVDIRYEMQSGDCRKINSAEARESMAPKYTVGDSSCRFTDYRKCLDYGIQMAKLLGYDWLVCGELGEVKPQTVLYGPHYESVLKINRECDFYDTLSEHSEFKDNNRLWAYSRWRTMAITHGLLTADGKYNTSS